MFDLPERLLGKFLSVHSTVVDVQIMTPERTLKVLLRMLCLHNISHVPPNPLFLDPAVSTVESDMNATFVESNYNVQLQGFWQRGQWEAVCDSRIPFHVN